MVLNLQVFYYIIIIVMLSFFLKITLIRCQDTIECNPPCSAGYECRFGICQRMQCTQNCTDVSVQRICGSNGVTYDNMCELNKSRCELAQDITMLYEGQCK